MSLKVEFRGVMLNFSAYTPQVGQLEEKENFQWEDGGEWNRLHWTCR